MDRVAARPSPCRHDTTSDLERGRHDADHSERGQLVLVRDGQRPEQHRVHDGEEADLQPEAQRQREDRGEARALQSPLFATHIDTDARSVLDIVASIKRCASV